MKRRLWAIILSATIVLASAIVASAGWYTPTTLIVPGFNGSAFTSNYATKTSTSTQCTFDTYYNQAWGLFGVDGRLLNSNGTPEAGPAYRQERCHHQW